MNISSLIVDVRAECLPAIRATLDQWPGIEVQATAPQGKLIVTIETPTDAESSEMFSRISAVDGVMSVAMVYHQFEPEPDQEVPHGIDAT